MYEAHLKTSRHKMNETYQKAPKTLVISEQAPQSNQMKSDSTWNKKFCKFELNLEKEKKERRDKQDMSQTDPYPLRWGSCPTHCKTWEAKPARPEDQATVLLDVSNICESCHFSAECM